MLSKAWVPAFYLEYLLIDPRPQPPQEGIRAKPTAGVSQVTCQLVLNPQVTSHQPRMGSCPTGPSVPSPTTRKLENPAASSREPAVTLPGVNHLDIWGLAAAAARRDTVRELALGRQCGGSRRGCLGKGPCSVRQREPHLHLQVTPTRQSCRKVEAPPRASGSSTRSQ